MTVLTHHDKKKDSKVENEHEEMDKNIGPLPKLSRAIGFEQKHVRLDYLKVSCVTYENRIGLFFYVLYQTGKMQKEENKEE